MSKLKLIEDSASMVKDSSPALVGVTVSSVTGAVWSVSFMELIEGIMQIGALLGSIGVSLVTIRYILRKTKKL